MWRTIKSRINKLFDYCISLKENAMMNSIHAYEVNCFILNETWIDGKIKAKNSWKHNTKIEIIKHA